MRTGTMGLSTTEHGRKVIIVTNINPTERIPVTLDTTDKMQKIVCHKSFVVGCGTMSLLILMTTSIFVWYLFMFSLFFHI